MVLLKKHPEIANRDCNDCMLWMYNETTGKPELRHGRKIPRRPGTAPCAIGKCPKGSPLQSKELLPHNLQAYDHYLECKAVGVFPDDVIVRRNASLIRAAEDYCQREEQSKSMLTIASVLKGAK